jgi:hypothetical protein
MSDLQKIHTNNRIISQTRAFTILRQCIVMSNTRPMNYQKVDGTPPTAESGVFQKIQQRSAGVHSIADPPKKSHRKSHRPHAIFHTYLLTWL